VFRSWVDQAVSWQRVRIVLASSAGVEPEYRSTLIAKTLTPTAA
jgi:hypothetical protein